MKNHIEDILACPKCLSKLTFSETCYQCTSCSNNYSIKQDAVFFTEVKNDIVVPKNDYAQNKQSWSSFKKRNYSFIESEIKHVSEESIILDIGSGPGFYDDLFTQYNKYYSLDFFNYPNIDIVSNIVEQKVPIVSSSIDYTILSNVLEHLNKPDLLLIECNRILKENGKISIIVPFIFKLHQEPYDYYRFTHYKLHEMLNNAGFKDIEIKKMGTITEVLKGIKYALSEIMRARHKNTFLLNQFLRIQYHLDQTINKLFLKQQDEELISQSIFTGYSCSAIKG